MKIAVLTCKREPHSIRSYRENVVRELQEMGVVVVSFSEDMPLPGDVDLYWDPRAAGGAAPHRVLKAILKPKVVTLHGAAPFALPAKEYFPNLRSAARGKLQNIKKLYEWRAFRGCCAAIITVSNYAKNEIEEMLGLKGEVIVPIYHGVNHSLFKPNTSVMETEPYLLHVSSYQPLKNVDRLIKAYQNQSLQVKPRLFAVVPGYPKKEASKDIKLIYEPLSHEQLVPLYQGAMGFLFPSLRETFGMPIIEAMACGCPVITSNVTGCAEIAGDAAILVDPRSTEAITNAMESIVKDRLLRRQLREKGLKRAAQFTWRKSAEKHLKVFENALRGKV